jgi:hypothetical protein
MKRIALLIAALTAIALAQAVPTKLEIQDVEVTVPVSPTNYPFFPVDYPGEVEVPVLATDAAGNGVGGVKVDWTVENRAKNPIYVIRAWDGGNVKRLKITLKAGEKATLGTTTDSKGETKIMLNATDAGQARLTITSGKLTALNLRGVVQTIDWIK